MGLSDTESIFEIWLKSSIAHWCGFFYHKRGNIDLPDAPVDVAQGCNRTQSMLKTLKNDLIVHIQAHPDNEEAWTLLSRVHGGLGEREGEFYAKEQMVVYAKRDIDEEVKRNEHI